MYAWPASVIELQHHDIMTTLDIPFSEPQNYDKYIIMMNARLSIR
jgi:hypothetical protein